MSPLWPSNALKQWSRRARFVPPSLVTMRTKRNGNESVHRKSSTVRTSELPIDNHFRVTLFAEVGVRRPFLPVGNWRLEGDFFNLTKRKQTKVERFQAPACGAKEEVLVEISEEQSTSTVPWATIRVCCSMCRRCIVCWSENQQDEETVNQHQHLPHGQRSSLGDILPWELVSVDPTNTWLH